MISLNSRKQNFGFLIEILITKYDFLGQYLWLNLLILIIANKISSSEMKIQYKKKFYRILFTYYFQFCSIYFWKLISFQNLRLKSDNNHSWELENSYIYSLNRKFQGIWFSFLPSLFFSCLTFKFESRFSYYDYTLL